MSFPGSYISRCLLCDLSEFDFVSCRCRFRCILDFMYLGSCSHSRNDARVSTILLRQLVGYLNPPLNHRYKFRQYIQCSHSYYHIVIIKSSRVYPPLPVLHHILHITQSPPRPTSLLHHPIPQFLNHRRFPLYPTLLINKRRRPTSFPRDHQILKVRKYRTNGRSR